MLFHRTLLGLGLFSFFDIRLNIKVCKESEEKGTEEQQEGDIDLGIVAVHKERGGGVDAPGDELDELHTGDVLLPPEVLLHAWPKAGHKVVEVHHNVDTDVEEHEEGGVAAADKLEEEPDHDGHHGVVHHVEGGHLAVLVPHHHEVGVHEVGELGEEIPPDCGGHEYSILSENR